MVPEGGRELGGKTAFRLCTNGVVVSPEDRGTGRDALLDGAGGGVERATAQVTADLAGLAVLAARRKPAVRFALTARTGRRLDCVSDVDLSPLDPRGCSGWGSRRASVVTRGGIRTATGARAASFMVMAFMVSARTGAITTMVPGSGFPPRVVHCHVCDGGKVSSVIGHQNRIGKQFDEMKTEKRIAATSSVDRAEWRNYSGFSVITQRQ